MSRSSFLYFFFLPFYFFTFTIQADTLDHEIHGTLFEAFGQCHLRDGNILQTVGSPTAFTKEMHVQVFIRFTIVAVAQLIAYTIATIFNDMYQPMLLEQR